MTPLQAAAWLQAHSHDPDVRALISGAMTRLGVFSVSDMAITFPQDVVLMAEAAADLLNQIPESEIR